MRANSAENIEEQLIPILRELLSEIKKRASDAGKWAALDKSLQTDLDLFVKLALNVRSSLMRQQWKGDSADFPDISRDCPKDPWIANQGTFLIKSALNQHIANCYVKQQDYRSKIKEQQEDFANFEAVVIQNIKLSLSTFYEWRAEGFSMHLDQIKTLKAELQLMNPQGDWSVFKNTHDNRFLVGPAPIVQVSDLKYDGCDDPGITIVKQGKLMKKEGVFSRSYRTMHVVLTHSSYLHCFPDAQFKAPPELSIDLTECKLIPLMMNEKEPEELALIAKSGLFGRETKYKFRGDSMEDSADWWGEMNQQMKKYAGARNLPTKVVDGETALKAAEAKMKSKSPASPTAPPPMPPRPDTESLSPQSPQHIAPSIFAGAEEQQKLTAEVPELDFPSPEKDPFAQLSLSERMEMKLNAAVKATTPTVFNLPQFEDAPRKETPTSTMNPWDTIEGDEARW